ncbi:ATP phosphoribosyltransferase [Cutibacterium acnes JCM 18909]|nr:ATP phosphoribosyltransferase [Cutibacterium acnes JCM 18909]
MLFRGAASSLLTEAGYRQCTDRKDLTLVDEANGVEFFYLRPRDIAVYVGEGALDIGITGRDLLLDSKADATEIKGLGFGHSRFRFAAPKGPKKHYRRVGGKADRYLLPRPVECFSGGAGD